MFCPKASTVTPVHKPLKEPAQACNKCLTLCVFVHVNYREGLPSFKFEAKLYSLRGKVNDFSFAGIFTLLFAPVQTIRTPSDYLV